MRNVSLILAVVASFFGLCGNAQSPLEVAPEHLAAFWPLDDGLTDASGNGHHPTVVQGVAGTEDRFGLPNAAQMFNGTNGMIEIPSAAAFNSLPITIAAWFKPNDVPAPGMGSQIIGKYIDASWNGWFMRYNTENNMIVPGYLVGIPAFGCDAVIDGYGCGAGLNQPGSFSWADAWHHVAFVVDETEGRLYMDGELWASQTWAGNPSPVTSSTSIRIGQKHGSGDGFNGAIDDVAIWSAALTAEEITLLSTYTNEGCMDEAACNYEAGANVPMNDECIYPILEGDCFAGSTVCGPNTIWNPTLQICVAATGCGCVGDLDFDGMIGVVDLLTLLASFGTQCPPSGCTWPQATNYDPDALTDDGSCMFPLCESPAIPGELCDDGDATTHNGSWDASGCNCVGEPNVDPSGAGPCEGMTSVTYHDEVYNLVEIGDQCWFREDLSTTLFTNGNAISNVTDYTEWSETNDPALSFGGNDTEEFQEYGGAYYNAYAILSPLGLCPTGWRVGSDQDWITLETTAGMLESELYAGGLRGNGVSEKLKSNVFDSIPWNGTNTLGLSITPGGQRVENGFFANRGGFAHIWSSTISSSENLWVREFTEDNDGFHRTQNYPNNRGFVARCVKAESGTCWDPDGDGVCAEEEVLGCNDDAACNYIPDATENDESCIYPGTNECGCPLGCDGEPLIFEDYLCECEIPGCQDTEACNYNPEATDADDSCTYPEIDDCGCEFDCDGNLLNDADGDGVCDNVDLTGCPDMSACNYHPNSCAEGIEFCIYGEGTAGESCDDNDPETFNDVYDALGCTCAGTPAVAMDGSGPCEGEETISYFDVEYRLVELGDQCWFRDNLATLHYTNGDSIPHNQPHAEWNTTQEGAAAYFQESVGLLNTWGAFYNGYAVLDGRGICPVGWRVSTEEDFQELELMIGMTQAQIDSIGWRGTNEGLILRGGPNHIGFSAKLAGHRTIQGEYWSIWWEGFYWMPPANADSTSALFTRRFHVEHYLLGKTETLNRQWGLSVRCLKE